MQRTTGRAQTAGNVGMRPTRVMSQSHQRIQSYRKTKAERVDERIEQLFESYKLIDQAAYA